MPISKQHNPIYCVLSVLLKIVLTFSIGFLKGFQLKIPSLIFYLVYICSAKKEIQERIEVLSSQKTSACASSQEFVRANGIAHEVAVNSTSPRNSWEDVQGLMILENGNININSVSLIVSIPDNRCNENSGITLKLTYNVW